VSSARASSGRSANDGGVRLRRVGFRRRNLRASCGYLKPGIYELVVHGERASSRSDASRETDAIRSQSRGRLRRDAFRSGTPPRALADLHFSSLGTINSLADLSAAASRERLIRDDRQHDERAARIRPRTISSLVSRPCRAGAFRVRGIRFWIRRSRIGSSFDTKITAARSCIQLPRHCYAEYLAYESTTGRYR